VTAVLLGRQAFAGDALWWLQIGSGVVVVLLGGWMLWRRLRPSHRHGHHAHHDHDHDHDHPDDDAHARAHAEQMPAYVGSGTRPAWWQVVAFGAAGGLVPCPASVSVMLLALSVGSTASGLVLVFGFSLGLAIALVGVGLVVVAGVSRLGRDGRFHAWSRHVPVVSATVVVASGIAAILIGLGAGRNG
jgi:nickel/cobalt exporter